MNRFTFGLVSTVFCVCSTQAFAHGTHTHFPPPNPGTGAAENLARGMVYLDKNSNGKRDRNEHGIAEVSVSNGLDVVQTDRWGRYEISLPPENILFISKPAEYEVPVNENNLPQFYYIHYPEGTPAVAEFEFPVIQPTGPLPSSIDFALLPSKERHGKSSKHKFRAMAFADPQAATDEFQDQVREDIVNELIDNPYKAEFGMVAGDVVDDNLDLYPRHIAMMGKIGIPLWNVPGNHDINFRSPDDKYANETYKSYFGPINFSFNHREVHFIGLDNVQYKGDGQGSYDNTSYRGYLSEEQLQWLRNDLRFVDKNKLIVIFTHISLITYALDGKGERYALGDNINTVNFADLVEILKPFNRVYAFAGHDTSNSWKVKVDHTHNWYGDWFLSHTLAEVRGAGWQDGPRDERDVRLAIMQDGNPNGYYVMTFDGTTVTPRFIPAEGDPNKNMRIVLDPLLEGTRDATGKVLAINRGVLVPGTKAIVNLFDGGERDLVEISIDGGEYVTMTNVLRTDPFLVRLRARFAGTENALSSPQPSSHIWEYTLPTLEAGLHVLRVRAEDEFGQKSKSSFSFEVSAE